MKEGVRRELWYVDTMVATPFQAIRRNIRSRPSTWSQSVDEFVWAMRDGSIAD
nr:hypothetical protein [uncultured bacterium]